MRRIKIPRYSDQTLRLCGYDRGILSFEDQLYESFVSLVKEYGIGWSAEYPSG